MELGTFLRAGVAFDARQQELLVATPALSGAVQCYDLRRDRGVDLIGGSLQEVSRTNAFEQRRRRKVARLALSPSGEWLFVGERWASHAGTEVVSLRVYKRAASGGWDEFSLVGAAACAEG